MVNVVPLRGTRVAAAQGDWTNDEIAELYRVEHVLAQAGIEIASDRGLSDENDPWFVFCRDDGTVIAHITRFDGLYRIYSPALRSPLVGRSFAEVTKSFAAGMPFARNDQEGRSVVRHPMALLSLLIATMCFLLESHSEAMAEPARDRDASLVEARVRDAAAVLTRHLSSEGRSASATSEAAYLAAISSVQIAALAALGGGMDEAHASGATAPRETGAIVDAVPYGVAPAIGGLRAAETQSSRGDNAEQSDFAAGLEQLDAAIGAGQLAAGTVAVVDGGLTVADADGVRSATLADLGAVPYEIAQLASDNDGAPAASKARTEPESSTHALELGGDGETIVITVAGGGQIVASGRGSLVVTEAGDGNIEISLGAKASVDVSVAYEAALQAPLEASAASTLRVQIALEGRSEGRFELKGAITQLALEIESRGSSSNVLTLTSAPEQTSVQVVVRGEQDIVLNQGAGVARNVAVDAQSLAGSLLYAIDLGSRHVESGSMVFDWTNFKAKANSSIALVNVPEETQIKIAVDLMRVLVDTVDKAGHAGDKASVALLGGADGVNIGVLSSNSVSEFAVATDLGEHRIGVLLAANLEHLVLKGEGALTIDRLAGIDGGKSQNLTIDAQALKGPLHLDLSTIAESTARSIAVVGGAGDDIITVDGHDGAAVLSGGGGKNIFKLTAGSTTYSITDLKPGDQVIIGDGMTRATKVGVVAADAVSQQLIDSQASVAGAATKASGLLGALHEAQSVLFTFHGEQYMFVDAQGNGSFGAADDAIVKVTGLSSQDLQGMFQVT